MIPSPMRTPITLLGGKVKDLGKEDIILTRMLLKEGDRENLYSLGKYLLPTLLLMESNSCLVLSVSAEASFYEFQYLSMDPINFGS